MDILTVIGLFLGIGAILGGQLLEGGSVSSILQLTAALIVVGGTIGAILLNYPLHVVMKAVRMAGKTFRSSDNTLHGVVREITGYTQVIRKDGLLALESHIKKMSTNPLLKRGLQLVVDGTAPHEIRDILEIELNQDEERKLQAAKVFESAGGYAPTIGILGAVLGLIHVMENLADPSMLGSGIAVAFVATVYGVGSANLLWLPIAGKLKVRIREESVRGDLIVEGVISLAKGENPRLVHEKLTGFLTDGDKKKAGRVQRRAA
ncbi:MAG: flagellar motor protein [Thermodesulfobacteriota bacterium]